MFAVPARRAFVRRALTIRSKAAQATASVSRAIIRPSLRERLIKTGARLVRHGRYAIFQMAEVAIPRRVFAAILTMINALRGPPRSGAPA